MSWPRCILRIAWCSGALALPVVAACGSTDRPPLLSDNQTTGGSPVEDDAGTSLFGGGGPTAPSCTVGVEGGVCACVDQPLDLDPPNLYFIMDRSGSMADSNKWLSVQRVLAELTVELGPRARFGAAVFPDPSADGCAPGVEVFPTRQGDSPAGVTGPTELAFVEVLGRIDASGGTPTAATFESLAPHIESLPGKTFVIFATDGGPNCNASATCDAAQCTYNIEGDDNCTPTGPNCCADPNNGGALSCLDSAPSIAGVTALAAAGIPVYVIGVPASEPYADLLDQLAQAGGTARGSEPQYYAVTSADQAALMTTMSSIAAQITGTCTLTLSSIPPDPSLVNVFFDGSPIPSTGPDGWTLTDSTVTILGASCQSILSGSVLDVRVVAGCPTVTQ